MKTKMKSRTKKVLVLSVMVVLLVATGVLNFVLNDKLTNASDNVNGGIDNNERLQESPNFCGWTLL